jgi:hypothetical protein
MTMMFMNLKIYGHGTGEICNPLLDFYMKFKVLHKTTVLTIFFHEINIFPLLDELSQKIILYFIMQ